MKKLSMTITLFISLTLTFPLPSHALSFTYSFLARSTENVIRPISPDQPPALSNTDALKIFLKPGKNTYIYLFLHDAEGGLSLLFPEKISDLDCCYRFNTPYSYPPGDEWTGFGETGGTEQFILLVSDTRLDTLEDLTAYYMEKFALYWKNPGKKSVEQEMAEARYAVLDRIRHIRLEHSDFTNIKERLVIIAGEFRNADEEVTGITVIAEGFYGKTIRIEHKRLVGEKEK